MRMSSTSSSETMSSHHYRSPAALIRETASLVSLPQVCLKLRGVLNDPDHTRRQVTEVIVHDPALTARLLRIVNSAYFGLSTSVRDISHALAILGEYDLHNLVVVTSIVQSVRATLPSSFDIPGFWRHSVFGAVLSRNLAEVLESPGKEELFICGLLLNLGKLPLYYREPALYQEVQRLRQERGAEDWRVERELLGFDHAEVGAELAKGWNFSDLMVETIARHHEKPSPVQPLHCRIAGIAGRFCDLPIDTIEADPEILRFDPAETGIDSNLLGPVLQNSVRGARHVFEAFFGQHYGT